MKNTTYLMGMGATLTLTLTLPLTLTLTFTPMSMAMAANPTSKGESTDRPNVVIFLSDDVSYNDLECYGSQNTKTPNINKLVEEGVKFNNCFQAVAMSSPTRHSLYTGVYPVKSGAYPNHTFVHDDVKSYVQYFGDEGYRTALYGKEHVSPKSVFSYDYLGNYKNGDMDFGAIKDYITASSEPFFMVVASHEAHHPFNCGDPERWNPEDLKLPPNFVDTPLTRLEYRAYLAEIEVLDSQVGTVRKILRDEGVSDNTIFIFLSEQGCSFPFAKWTCYGQGLHSAMVVSYPGVTKAGEQSDALVEYIDVLPTVMEFAGIEPASTDVDGESFAQLLKGKKREHKKQVFGLHTNTGVNYGTLIYGIRTVSDKKYRYIHNLHSDSTYYNLIQRTEWWAEWVESGESGDEFAQQQINNYEHRPTEELYDQINDPFEMNNLASDPKYRGVIKSMRKELDQWMESQGDKGAQTDKDALYRLLPGMRRKYEKNPIFQ